ncbi:MAG: hypothetical protein HC878_03260 [Leptolyngbyaceae cyanobacterium SL_5_14]|nr:hypothetical protein [Leptolyngbyaceae cyanobacterium SL_5_14]
MPLFIRKPTKISLGKARGADSHDTYLAVILVLASVELTSQALAEIKQMNVREQDIYGCNIEVQHESTFIVQFKEHVWSLIYKALPPRRNSQVAFSSLEEAKALLSEPARTYSPLTESDALEISKLLSTSAIYYSESDTVGISQYYLYNEEGALVERFFYEEGQPIQFQSKNRHIEVSSIRNAHKFVAEFMHEQNAYVPYIQDRRELVAGQRTCLYIEGLEAYDIECMDYVARK